MQTEQRPEVLDFLKRHGGPRRFEPGASGNASAIVDLLRVNGYEVRAPRGLSGRASVRQPGTRKWVQMSLRQMGALADDLRIADGLPPIQKREVAE